MYICIYINIYVNIYNRVYCWMLRGGMGCTRKLFDVLHA